MTRNPTDRMQDPDDTGRLYRMERRMHLADEEAAGLKA